MFGLGSVVSGDRRLTINETVVLEWPFCRLRHFALGHRASAPRLLIVAPLSGHRVGLLRDTVVALVPDHDVYVIDWTDAREVPAEQGRFGLDENIAYVMDLLRVLGPGMHVFAVSQSPVPTLAAAALLADADDPVQPRSMTLVSGFLDPWVNSRRFDVLTAGAPMAILGPTVTDRVPAGFPGCGRHIYPAWIQRTALALYLNRHIARRRELLQKVLRDDGDDPGRYPFLDLYFDIMDLPAELYVDVMLRFFHRCEIARGRMRWRGISVSPAAIAKTALMTVEGESDDVSPPGQTSLAHDLCIGIPSGWRARHLQRGVGHFGTFHGMAWKTQIAPRVRAFIHEAEARANRGGIQPGRPRPQAWPS